LTAWPIALVSAARYCTFKLGFGAQVAPRQTLGDAQSASLAHDVLQAFVPQMYGVHPDVVTVWQVPAPLQVRAGVNVVPEHDAATQVVPAMYSRQAPEPLQVPSVPQLAAPASAHWFNGSRPIPTFVHVPSVPASAHDLHVAVQVVAQQMFWAQMPLAQSLFAVQAAPLGRFVQTPVEQTLGDTQSVSAVHDVLHAPVPQTNGSHIDIVAA
jgi:hypothetical protein